jgi:hypothetical protein
MILVFFPSDSEYSKKKLSDCSVQREMLVQLEGEKNSCKKNLIFLSREKKNSDSWINIPSKI